jgi:non-homologous end joining protein Ku
LRFQDEVRSLEDIGLPRRAKPEAALVSAYRKAIEKNADDALDTELLRDEGVAQVKALIAKKEKQHRDVVEHETVTGEAPEARIIDLMEVLKESLTKDAKKVRRA